MPGKSEPAEKAREQTPDQLRNRICALEAENAQLRADRRVTWVPPGHFYSPLVDPADPIVSRILNDGERELPPADDLRIDTELQLAWLERISSHYPQLPFSELPCPNRRYYYRNPAFSYTDAIVYFGILVETRPARIVEVGSGYSSALAMDTNDELLDEKTRLTFIDPYPKTVRSLLRPDDKYTGAIVPKRLQDLPTSTFHELEANDILFIDSSHVAKTGSDVNEYMFRVLPVLQRGVRIHIHDIFYPFEYEAAWIVDENRSWNEAYLLRAFLQYNSAFRVIYFNDFMFRKFEPLVASKMPLCRKGRGGSIWLERV
jgi:hypothetical protein